MVTIDGTEVSAANDCAVSIAAALVAMLLVKLAMLVSFAAAGLVFL